MAEKKLHQRTEKKWHRRKVIFVFLGIAYAILEAFGHFHPDQKHLIEEIFRTLMVALLLYVLEETLSAKEIDASEGRWAELIKKNRRSVAAKVLRKFNNEVSDGPSEDDGRLSMKPAWLAKHSYELFWDVLVERNKSSKQGLDVAIVHSSELEVWSQHPRLLQLQGIFCNDGGKVTRIICGSDYQPSQNVVKIARGMKDVGVKVLYYHLNSNRHKNFLYDFSWDFALVKNTQDVCVWNTLGRTDITIQQAEYFTGIEYRGQNLVSLFEQLEKESVPI